MTNKKISPPRKMSARNSARRAPVEAKPPKTSNPIQFGQTNDAVKLIRNLAQQQQDDMFAGMINMVVGINLPGMGDFASTMICQDLLEREKTVVAAKWYETCGMNTILSAEEATKRYVEARIQAEKKLGKKNLVSALDKARFEHNECARANLDSSNGMLFCYVLPNFNSDGTHGPVGPKDVPWNQTS